MAASVERFYGLSPKVATAAQSNLARCCCCCCCWSIVAVDFYCAEFDTYTSVYVLSRYSPLKDGQLYKCHTLSSGTCHLPLSTRHTHFCYSTCTCCSLLQITYWIQHIIHTTAKRPPGPQCTCSAELGQIFACMIRNCHWLFKRYYFNKQLVVCLSGCLAVCMSAGMSVCLNVCLSVFLLICLPFESVFVAQSVFLSDSVC